jgi:hypothetical protein
MDLQTAAATVAAVAAATAAVLSATRKTPSLAVESSRDAALRRLDLSRLLRRLVSEDGLGSLENAVAAIAEYKRFLRLARLHPAESLQPSAAVDAVWQRHLLDTKVYEADCLELFGTHAHRLYPPQAGAAQHLARTRELLLQEAALLGPPSGPSAALWGELPTVPAMLSVSPSLPAPPRPFTKLGGILRGGRAPSNLAPLANEELEWLGAAVAKELPLKQSACKHAEPLRQIACTDPAAAVREYKRFLQMMIDDSGVWLTPSKLVDELWHRHMLDSVNYSSFCERVAGCFLHHTPHYGEPRASQRRMHAHHRRSHVWASDSNTIVRVCVWAGEPHSYHDPGFKKTLQMYAESYGTEAPKTIWGTVGESGGGGGCGGGGCGGGGGVAVGGGGGGGGGGGSGGGGSGSGGTTSNKECLVAVVLLGIAGGYWWLATTAFEMVEEGSPTYIAVLPHVLMFLCVVVICWCIKKWGKKRHEEVMRVVSEEGDVPAMELLILELGLTEVRNTFTLPDLSHTGLVVVCSRLSRRFQRHLKMRHFMRACCVRSKRELPSLRSTSFLTSRSSCVNTIANTIQTRTL